MTDRSGPGQFYINIVFPLKASPGHRHLGMTCSHEVAGREFQPLEPNKLPEQLAQQHAGRKPRLALQARGSKFQRFQEVRIQELSCEVSC